MRARDRAFTLPVCAGLAMLLAGALYQNALRNPFVYDDYRLIVENRSILNLQDLRGIVSQDMTRPLVNLTYAMDAAMWGPAPFGFHLTSLLLHMLNVGLVFYTAWLVSEDRRRQSGQLLPAVASSGVVATSTAVLVASHPLMTQAVGYISGRSEVLYAALFLLAFLSARQWMLRGGRRWWLAAVSLWALSLMAKETAVMLGAALFVYDRVMLEADVTERRRRLLGLHLPLLSIALVAALIRVVVLTEVEYPDGPLGDWRFALVAIRAYWRYVALLAVPRGQSIFHDVPGVSDLMSASALVLFAGSAAVLMAIWRLRRVHSVVAFGCWWFILLLVPSGVLFTLGRGEPMAEHRVYGASIGMFLVAGSAFGMLAHRFDRRGPLWRGLLYGLSALFVLQLGARTMVRNAIWSDPVRLSREAVGMSPDHWMPRLLLAEALRTTGRCAEAIPEYRTAIALRPQEAFGYTKLAACLIGAGQLDEAANVFAQLDGADHRSPQASTGLGLIELLRNRPAEGQSQFLRTLDRRGSDPVATQLLAFVDGTLDREATAAVCSALASLTAGAEPTDLCRSFASPGPRP